MRYLNVVIVMLILLSTASLAFAEVDPDYDTVVRERAEKIVATLGINDSAKADRVTDIIAQQYKDLSSIHDARDAEYKTVNTDQQKAAIYERSREQLQALHESYLAKLHVELTSEQVDLVKDGMTYDVANITYTNYLAMLPNLTDAQKAHIRSQLLEARELAMDAGSADEKHRWFGKYKGRINNYLSAEGYDLKQASRAWAERRKAAAGASERQD